MAASPAQPNDEISYVETENRSSVVMVIDGPGDTTRRPLPPNYPRFWPADVPFPPPDGVPPES